ncbi:MAG: hypothetical protein AB7F41_06330 [Methylocystis sp.]|uniref:hypothetical protein n=1 Tax=Methylocystis sp. TaxID=1911079 RepID=UPI003D0DD0CA
MNPTALSVCAAGVFALLSAAFAEDAPTAGARPSTRATQTLAGDAKVAGTAFHATGEIPCARYAGQPMAQCRFGVIRQGDSDATVRVFWPDGGIRNIYFKRGKAQSSDSRDRIRSEKTVDLNQVLIGATERFEIPDAVIFGG